MTKDEKDIIVRGYKQELIEHLEMFDLRAWHAWEAAQAVLGLFPEIRTKALLGR